MSSTTNLLLGLALAIGTLAAPAVADDAAALQQAKDQIKYFDRDIKKAKDPGRFASLMYELAATRHPLVVKRIGKVLVKTQDEDRKMIAAAILGREFTKPEEVRLEAGKVLTEALTAKKMPDDVIDSAVIAIGQLLYTPAVPELNVILRKGGNPWLLLTTVRISGDLKDWRSLPALLELWERHPVGVSWETGEVNVDTGASGDTDQKEAERQWQAKYGNSMHAKGKPAVMLKVYVKEIAKAVKKITGEPLSTPTKLREWMEAHRAELKKLGIDIPRAKDTSKKKDDEKNKKGK